MRFGPGCFVHDRSTIWADASRSVDPVCASGGMALLGDSERAKCNCESQHNAFHFECLTLRRAGAGAIAGKGAGQRRETRCHRDRTIGSVALSRRGRSRQ